MTIGGFILTAGLAALLRWLVDDVTRPSPGGAMVLAALAAGLTMAKTVQVEGLAGGISGALFVGIGGLGLGWFLLSLTDGWSRQTTRHVGLAGLGAVLLSLFVR